MNWMETAPLTELMAQAAQKRNEAFGRNISYSRKVFIPLTKLCRDVCHYCTFAQAPRPGDEDHRGVEEHVEEPANGIELPVLRDGRHGVGHDTERRVTPQVLGEVVHEHREEEHHSHEGTDRTGRVTK